MSSKIALTLDLESMEAGSEGGGGEEEEEEEEEEAALENEEEEEEAEGFVPEEEFSIFLEGFVFFLNGGSGEVFAFDFSINNYTLR